MNEDKQLARMGLILSAQSVLLCHRADVRTFKGIRLQMTSKVWS